MAKKKKSKTVAQRATERARARVEVCKSLDAAMRQADLSTYYLRKIGAAQRHINQSKRARDLLADLLKNCV